MDGKGQLVTALPVHWCHRCVIRLFMTCIYLSIGDAGSFLLDFSVAVPVDIC
jgi:hypothetical protein